MSGDVVSLPDPSPLWEAHEHPDRPLDPGAMLCSCVTCEAMILAQAERTPGMGIALATRCDRIVVAADYLAEVMAVDRTLAPLLYVRDDYVRRLYLPVDGWWFFPPERWWSEACRDDEDGGRAATPEAPGRQAPVRRQSPAVPRGGGGRVGFPRTGRSGELRPGGGGGASVAAAAPPAARRAGRLGAVVWPLGRPRSGGADPRGAGDRIRQGATGLVDADRCAPLCQHRRPQLVHARERALARGRACGVCGSSSTSWSRPIGSIGGAIPSTSSASR